MLERLIYVIAGTEWFWVLLLIICAYLLYYILIKRPQKEKKARESVILSIIRSRNGATIDDIIIGAHLSAEEASNELNRLLSKGVVKSVEREGKTYYVIA
jgi:predicted transcriptional regulator